MGTVQYCTAGVPGCNQAGLWRTWVQPLADLDLPQLAFPVALGQGCSLKRLWRPPGSAQTPPAPAPPRPEWTPAQRPPPPGAATRGTPPVYPHPGAWLHPLSLHPLPLLRLFPFLSFSTPAPALSLPGAPAPAPAPASAEPRSQNPPSALPSVPRYPFSSWAALSFGDTPAAPCCSAVEGMES